MPRANATLTTLPHGGVKGVKVVEVACGGKRGVFKVPEELDENDDYCFICSDSLYHGSIVALPHCPQCKTTESVLAHADCARKYLQYHIPIRMRPGVRHPICPMHFDPVPPVLGYMVCTDIMGELDQRCVPAGRCEDCKMTLDTRQGHLLHKNLRHPQADRALLSKGEKALLHYSPELFQCVSTHIACQHCGFMDAVDQLKAHETVCQDLSADQRILLKNVLVKTQNEKFEFHLRRDATMRTFHAEQELLAEQARLRQDVARDEEDLF